MAAPSVPVATQLSKGFWQLAIDMVTICSNLIVPTSAADQFTAGVLSGATATIVVAALTAQRNLL